MKPTVFAVMKVMILIPVRNSSAEETLADLYSVSKREAEHILRSQLPNCFSVVGEVQFSHAVIKES